MVSGKISFMERALWRNWLVGRVRGVTMFGIGSMSSSYESRSNGLDGGWWSGRDSRMSP
jgi:hypothetical protein